MPSMILRNILASYTVLRLITRSWSARLFVFLVPWFLMTTSAYSEFSGLENIVDVAGANTFAVFAPGETDRVFLGTRDGVIRIVDVNNKTSLATPFLTIPNVDTEGEGALISLAFHPDYQSNGKFYVNFTQDNGGIPIEPVVEGVLSPFTSHVYEYTVSTDPNIANTTRSKVIEWVQPANIHNGGWMGFGPNDGNLYITVGDGGVSRDGGNGDPGATPIIGNAQDITDNLFGKVVRIDVNGTDAYPGDPDRNYAIPASNPFVGVLGDDEIWAYGLRNPFRASFDRATADFLIGDVGFATHEEINFQLASSPGGANYGWRYREGLEETPGPGGGPKPVGNVDPIYDYLHNGKGDGPEFEGNSVTGGYVYRGPDPDLQGKYIFADFISNQVWTFDPTDAFNTVENITDTLALPGGGLASRVTSFAEDAHGNLYVVTISGKLHRILTDSVTPGDFDSNAKVDGVDLGVWQTGFGTISEAENSSGDADEDGDVDGTDFLAFQRNFGYNSLNVGPGTSSLSVPEPTSCALAGACFIAFTVVSRHRRLF